MQCHVVVLDKPLIHCWYLYCVAAVESREDEDSDEGQEVARTTLKRRELENRRDER